MKQANVDSGDTAVFVVPDVAASPPMVEWAAKICGAAVLVPEVLTGRRLGPIVTYKSALLVGRKVFVSARFRTAFPGQCALLDAVVPMTSSKWTLMADLASFQAAKEHANNKSLNATVVGLFTDDEIALCQGLPEFLKRHMFNASGFLSFVQRMELPLSNMGAGQL